VWKNNLITVRDNPLTVLRHGKIMDFEEIGKIPERYWGYAYVKPRTEKKLKSALEARSIPCFLPLIPKARMHHATKVVSFLPMIPGYVFLSVTDEERRELKISEKHIVQIELLRESSSEETFIRELNILKRCEILAQSEPVLINPEIAAGDDVVVTDGPLSGLQAKVLRRADEANSIVLNLTILNSHIEYPVSAETLKKTVR
jgi:transcription antitermination factor NusG